MSEAVVLDVPVCLTDPADGDELEVIAELELRRDATTGGVELAGCLGYYGPELPGLSGFYALADFGPHAEAVQAATLAAFDRDYSDLRDQFEDWISAEAQTWSA